MLSRVRATMRGFRRENRAAAMVEFAIVAPILFVLVFGIIDFGRVFFLYNNLTNAAREGARRGAVMTPDVAATTTAIEAVVRSRINDSNNNATTWQVVTTYPGTTAAGTKTVRVQIVDYPFTPVTFLAIKAAKQLDVQAEFRAEFQ